MLDATALTYVNLIVGILFIEPDEGHSPMDRKSDDARLHLAQSGTPLIWVIILSLGLWAAIWRAVTSVSAALL
jgi:hypothetical protein